jgi:hypothetical protein
MRFRPLDHYAVRFPFVPSAAAMISAALGADASLQPCSLALGRPSAAAEQHDSVPSDIGAYATENTLAGDVRFLAAPDRALVIRANPAFNPAVVAAAELSPR